MSVSSLRHKQSRVEPGTLARPAYLWFFVVANVSMWIQHLQDKAAAARGVTRWMYTLAGGRRGTAGLTPAEIEKKAFLSEEQRELEQASRMFGLHMAMRLGFEREALASFPFRIAKPIMR